MQLHYVRNALSYRIAVTVGALLCVSTSLDYIMILNDELNAHRQGQLADKSLLVPRISLEHRQVAKPQQPLIAKKQYPRPDKVYKRSAFTMDDFSVAGVNLAKYGFSEEEGNNEISSAAHPPFELYEDFDISSLIQGDEGWWDLIKYRKQLERPSLSFYGDKVAQKRWMQAMGIPHPKPYFLKYASELTTTGQRHDEEAMLLKQLIKIKDYVAKPTHRSGSSGVFVVKYDTEAHQSLVGYGGDSIEDAFDKHNIAARLVKDLHKTAKDHESWALKHVQPGLMLEERFTEFSADKYAATEFKVFTIWGRAWITNWRQGSYRPGLVHRNGTVVDWERKNQSKLPEWVDWNRVIEIAENLGRNKDLFRVDIFVGVPADSPSLQVLQKDKAADTTTKNEQLKAAAQYVVSEVAFHPTSEFGNKNGIFDEGARLWLAGYKVGNYKVVPNTEVPDAFRQKRILSKEDAQELAVKTFPSITQVLRRR